MDSIAVQRKEKDERSCVVDNIQICLNCGSKNIIITDNEIRCNSCENIKSKCEVEYFV